MEIDDIFAARSKKGPSGSDASAIDAHAASTISHQSNASALEKEPSKSAKKRHRKLNSNIDKAIQHPQKQTDPSPSNQHPSTDQSVQSIAQNGTKIDPKTMEIATKTKDSVTKTKKASVTPKESTINQKQVPKSTSESTANTVQIVEFGADIGTHKPMLASLKSQDDDGFADSRGTSKRTKTDDGLDIYTDKELKIGQGGDTPECPFDCWCCY